MTPSSAASEVADYGTAIARFRDVLIEKLEIAGLAGAERDRVLARLDELHEAWKGIATSASVEGGNFTYENKPAERRLLQDPLRPLPTDMDGTRGWFAAGRSMRDTEPAALLRIRRPDGSSFKGSTP
jgi:hypothetical protein